MEKEETIALNSASINKETIAMVVSNSLALAESGEKSYIELITLGSKLEKIGKELKDKASAYAVDEMSGDKDTRFACDLQVVETSVKYNYETSSIYSELVDEIARLDEVRKSYEKQMQSVSKTGTPCILLNANTGEQETIEAVSKSSKTTVKVTIK